MKVIDKTYYTPIKQSNTMPLKFQNKLRTHRDSFSKLNEPTSVGKIIRQINGNNESNASLADSRNTFFNNKDRRKEKERNDEMHNP